MESIQLAARAAVFGTGFVTGGGLIVAIGAQNAFVLARAVKGEHPLLVTAICALCDALLIACGVLGLGALVATNPLLTKFAAAGGVVFLFIYGLSAFKSALRGDVLTAEEESEPVRPDWRSVALATLAVTLLNPHVYLDTIVFLGSVAGQFPDASRPLFGLGAATASLCWFTALTLFGRALGPLFSRPHTWRILDGTVCLVMWTIGATLALTLL